MRARRRAGFIEQTLASASVSASRFDRGKRARDLALVAGLADRDGDHQGSDTALRSRIPCDHEPSARERDPSQRHRDHDQKYAAGSRDSGFTTASPPQADDNVARCGAVCN